MTPQTRNEIVNEVFNEITQGKNFFLGFEYDPMKQKGSCNCTNTGFKRIPTFTVTHKEYETVLSFKTFHGNKEIVRVKADSDNFRYDLFQGVQDQLQKYVADWNDSDTNPFHPDYDDWNYDLGPKPPEEG